MTQDLKTTVLSLIKNEFDYKETCNVLGLNKSIWWSWGVSQIIPVRKTQKDNYCGLLMKVNGHHHKGYVLITLLNDIYQVHIINNRGRILNSYEEVYVDVLVEVIDNRIEKIKDYKF